MNYDNEIYIGIVLYNPLILQLKNNISLLDACGFSVICIDNGSDNVNEINELIKKFANANIVNNPENNGIAKALNQLLEWGRKRNFSWCLTMDQDSLVTSAMIDEMKKYLYIEKVGIITPLVIDINNSEHKSFIENNMEIEFVKNATDVITSGSLVNLNIANIIGNYDDRLFIDFVDTEFQERLIRNGYKIIKVNSAVLYHQVGKIKVFKFFGKKIICTNHSAYRRYYQVRNRLFYKKKYFGLLDFRKEQVRLIIGTFKIMIFETDVIEKIKSTIKGFKDYKKLL